MDSVRYLNLGLRFLLELTALVALGWWGFHVGGSTVGELILGLGLPVLAAIIWMLFVAPKARFPVALKFRAAIETAIFIAAALAFWGVGHHGLAEAFVVATVISQLLLYGLGEPMAGERR